MNIIESIEWMKSNKNGHLTIDGFNDLSSYILFNYNFIKNTICEYTIYHTANILNTSNEYTVDEFKLEFNNYEFNIFDN